MLNRKNDALKILVDNARFTFLKSINSWQSAILIASLPLINQDVIKKEYVDEIINSINKYGPYIVLDNNVAIPHISGSSNVKETSLSLLILEEPVIFKVKDESKSANIIFVLASDNDEGHIANMQELFQFTMDKKLLEKLSKCNNLLSLKKIINEIE